MAKNWVRDKEDGGINQDQNETTKAGELCLVELIRHDFRAQK